MANLAVAVKMKIKLPNGQRVYASPVVTGNGKMKKSYALVDGKEEHHPEGVYTLVWRENGRLKTKAYGPGDDITIQKTKKESYLRAVADKHIESEVARVDTRRLMKAAVDDYLKDNEAKADGTYGAYRNMLAEFTESCKKKYLEQVDREDWKTFIESLKEKGHSPRTVFNKVSYLKTFFLNYGLSCPLQKNDKALFKYTEKKVRAYNQVDLAALFSKLSIDENDLFQFFLCTGARDAEVQFAFWRDIDLTARTFSVKAKQDLDFNPKDFEERIIPIPQSLVDLLRERRERHRDDRLIFPAAEGGVDTHFLRILKSSTFENDLNCRDCITPMKKRKNGQITGGLSCKSNPVCEKWQLHRFRKTFATMHHHNGVPVRTIQKWLGHSDIETTLLYLADVDDETEETQTILNKTFAFLNADQQ